MSTIEIPRSALIVLDCLKENGPLPPKDISKRANIPLRTVSFALRKLVGWEICKKIPNLADMRRPLYHIDRDKMRAVFMKYGRVLT